MKFYIRVWKNGHLEGYIKKGTRLEITVYRHECRIYNSINDVKSAFSELMRRYPFYVFDYDIL